MEVIENHNDEDPLFLYLAYQAPHMNIQKPPQKYLDLYEQAGDSRSPKIYQDSLPDDSQALYRAAAISVSIPIIMPARYYCSPGLGQGGEAGGGCSQVCRAL